MDIRIDGDDDVIINPQQFVWNYISDVQYLMNAAIVRQDAPIAPWNKKQMCGGFVDFSRESKYW